MKGLKIFSIILVGSILMSKVRGQGTPSNDLNVFRNLEDDLIPIFNDLLTREFENCALNIIYDQVFSDSKSVKFLIDQKNPKQVGKSLAQIFYRNSIGGSDRRIF